MPATAGFLKLENRYTITARLKMPSAMHIGSGTVNAKTDSPFFQGQDGPIIPGSSIRGVLRSRLEKILQAVGGNRGCVLFFEDPNSRCFTSPNSKLKKEFDEEHRNKTAAERERLLEDKLLTDGLCDICRLFGSVLLASKLRISDAKPVKPELLIRDGVGIDRDTETAREHIKYDFETLYSDGFTFQADIENATDPDLALLAILFQEMLNPGIEIGGKKSRGLGICTLVKGTVSAKGFSDREGLIRFLGSGVLEPIPDFEQKLTSCLNAYLGGNHNVAPGKK